MMQLREGHSNYIYVAELAEHTQIHRCTGSQRWGVVKSAGRGFNTITRQQMRQCLIRGLWWE